MAIPIDPEWKQERGTLIRIVVAAVVITVLWILLVACGSDGGSMTQTEAIDKVNHTLQAIATEQAGCH